MWQEWRNSFDQGGTVNMIEPGISPGSGRMGLVQRELRFDRADLGGADELHMRDSENELLAFVNHI
jgi:hypothetical protein